MLRGYVYVCMCVCVCVCVYMCVSTQHYRQQRQHYVQQFTAVMYGHNSALKYPDSQHDLRALSY